MPTTSISHRNQPIRSGASLFDVFRQRFADFLFPPGTDKWLTILRLGLGLQVILYCLSLRKDWNQLLGGNGSGLINRDLMEAMIALDAPFVPKLGWLIALGSQLGFSGQAVLFVAWGGLLCAGCFLLLGLFCRSSAIIAWFLYICAVKSGNLLVYGVDTFTTIGLFYLMLSPLPDRASLDWQLRNRPSKDPQLVGFFRRVLQLHLCVIYFSSGITKSLGIDWWTGESMWRALTRPPFNIVPPQMIISWKAVLPLVGIAVCLFETGYPIFIWPKRTRLIWLVAILGMHIAVGLTMGLYLFSLIMIVLNLAAFGPGIGRKQGKAAEFASQEAIP